MSRTKPQREMWEQRPPPTPEETKNRCALIRRSWQDPELRRQLGLPSRTGSRGHEVEPWQPPLLVTPDEVTLG